MNKMVFVFPLALLASACASTSSQSGPSASAALQARSGSQVSGKLTFTQVGNGVRVTGDISGHTPGAKGFHIHDKGDCSAADGMSAGGHFNPAGAKHGAPGSGHAGDLGNLVFDASGRASVNVMVDGVSLSSGAANNIIGRAVIVHAQPDDLKTDPTGNAGGRAACGVIAG
jgi:Cu-Zn family superoxide dismutase